MENQPRETKITMFDDFVDVMKMASPAILGALLVLGLSFGYIHKRNKQRIKEVLELKIDDYLGSEYEKMLGHSYEFNPTNRVVKSSQIRDTGYIEGVLQVHTNNDGEVCFEFYGKGEKPIEKIEIGDTCPCPDDIVKFEQK